MLVAYFSSLHRGSGSLGGRRRSLAVTGSAVFRMPMVHHAPPSILALLWFAGIASGASRLATPRSRLRRRAIPVLGTAASHRFRHPSSDQPHPAASRPLINPITLPRRPVLLAVPVALADSVVIGLALFDESVTFQIVVLLLSLAVSVASYHGIEQPILRSEALAPQKGSSRRPRRFELHRHTQYVLVAGMAFAVLLLSVVALTPKEAPHLDRCGSSSRRATERPSSTGSCRPRCRLAECGRPRCAERWSVPRHVESGAERRSFRRRAADDRRDMLQRRPVRNGPVHDG